MTEDRTPVLVGAAAVTQRETDPARAREPIALMGDALERAAEDAGSRALLARADAVRVPRGFWDYADPGRLLAERFGAGAARTSVAEIGVLQTTVLGAAARDIADGRADVVLVAGGEARHREQCARRAGVEATLTRQRDDVVPDEVMRPHAEILSPAELAVGLHLPVNQYAILENALRFADGQDVEAHRDAVAALQARAAQVAAGNPDAWDRSGRDAATIRDAGAGNRMLAFPYTKLHTSQWNVDQAAGLILCSVGTARSLGLDARRFVFPLVVADSNQMVPLVARPALHRVPGFAAAGRRAFAHAGIAPNAVDAVELYSCFPVAVRVQTRELGIDASRPLTVTGGMTFAGGPLNNFVLQALVKLAALLREAPGRTGLATAVSGMLTKQGVSLWASQPPEAPFAFLDVSEETARAVAPVALAEDFEGPARIAGYTVLFEGERPARALFVCDVEDGRRALATSDDPELALRGTREELAGRPVRIAGGSAALTG